MQGDEATLALLGRQPVPRELLHRPGGAVGQRGQQVAGGTCTGTRGAVTFMVVTGTRGAVTFMVVTGTRGAVTFMVVTGTRGAVTFMVVTGTRGAVTFMVVTGTTGAVTFMVVTGTRGAVTFMVVTGAADERGYRKDRVCLIVCLLVAWVVVCFVCCFNAPATCYSIAVDNCTCCHTETEVADQTHYLTKSQ